MTKWLIVAVIVLLAIVGAQYKQVEMANEKWKTAEANVKAYSSELSYSKERNTALQLTVEQLGYFKDSVLVELNNTREELKIKDKNLKALAAVASKFTKKDTVYLDSIIFKEPDFAMDTILGDEWYTLRLGLKYPSMIAVEPEFKSQKHIIVSTKKETVNPPKKCFLLRWLQKKHTILHVDVIEKNPYTNDESSKFVEIIK